MLVVGIVMAAVLQLHAVSASDHQAASTVQLQGCSAAALKNSSVVTTLDIQAHGLDSPQFTATTVITVPEAWNGAQALLGNPYGSEFRDSISCFLPTFQNDYRPSPPHVVVAHGTITVTDVVLDSTDGYNGNSYTAGPWQAALTGSTATISITVPQSSSSSTRWSAVLDSPDLRVSTLSSDPTSTDGDGQFAWQNMSPNSVSNLTLEIAWPARAVTDHDLGRWPLKFLLELLWSCGSLLTFALPLLFLRRQRRTRNALGIPEDPESRWKSRLLAAACQVGLCLTLVSILDDWLWDSPDFGPAETPISKLFFGGNSFSTADVQSRLEVFFLLVMGGWLAIAAWPKGRRGPYAAFVCTIIVVATALQGWPRAWSGTVSPALDYGSADPNFTLHLSASTLRILVFTALPVLLALELFLAGAIMGICRLWPVKWRGQPRETTTMRTGTVAVVHAAALLLSAATVLEVAYAADSNWKNLSVLGNGQQIGQVNWAIGWIIAAPHWILNYGDLQSLLTLLVGVALITWLHSMSLRRRGLFLPGSRAGLRVAILAFLFAAISMGTWGEDATYTVPIVFIVSYVLVRRAALETSIEELDRDIRVHPVDSMAPGTSRLVLLQSVLLDAADTRARLRRKIAALDQDGPPGEAAHRSGDRRRELEREVELLTYQWVDGAEAEEKPTWRTRVLRTLTGQGRIAHSAATTFTAPRRIDPGQTALRLGPYGDWWDNGWYAARVSLVPSIIVTAYYTYYSISQGSMWQLNTDFGLIEGLLGEVSGIAGWMAMAFALGCLYPYLRGGGGAVKGLTLGLVCAAALTADAIPTFLLNDEHYSLFYVDCLIYLAFTVLIGILMDQRTLSLHHRSLGWVAALYRTATLRTAVSYAVALVITFIGIWQQIHVTNNVDQQRAQIVSQVIQQARSQLTSGR